MRELQRLYSEGPLSIQALLTNGETYKGLRIAVSEQEATLRQERGNSGQKLTLRPLGIA